MKHAEKLLFVLLPVFLLLAGCAAGKAPSSSPAAEPENTETLYATMIQYGGEDESTAAYLKIAERSKKLFPLLEEQVGAFSVNAYNYQTMDEDGTPLYTMNTLHYPIEIDPNGYTIEVSKNYFRYFPVETVEESPVENLLAEEDNTLNLLVPEQFRDQEQDIIKAHRERFYFEKVEAENEYNKSAGRPDRLDLRAEDLQINVIYVKDGQRYCLLRSDCAMDTGGWVTDPIVRIYTSNTHCNYAHSLLSQWTYFFADTSDPEEAFERILPAVKACGAEESFQKVQPADMQPTAEE